MGGTGTTGVQGTAEGGDIMFLMSQRSVMNPGLHRLLPGKWNLSHWPAARAPGKYTTVRLQACITVNAKEFSLLHLSLLVYTFNSTRTKHSVKFWLINFILLKVCLIKRPFIVSYMNKNSWRCLIVSMTHQVPEKYLDLSVMLNP